MEYTEFQYLWPPRPETKIPSGMLGFYEKRKWVAQVKKNGTLTVIFARGKEVIFKTRHPGDNNGDHRQWTPSAEHIRFFQSSSTKWNVYVAELIHNKTQHIKNQLYIFDQLVKDGEQLVGVSFEDRHAMLLAKWKILAEEADQHRVHQYVSIAKNLTGDLKKIYDAITPKDGILKENEGLVLKDPKAPLKMCLQQKSNAAWQVKCRVFHKNYGF